MPRCYVKIGSLKRSIALDVDASDTIANFKARIRSKVEIILADRSTLDEILADSSTLEILKDEPHLIRFHGKILADRSTLDEILADSWTRGEREFCFEMTGLFFPPPPPSMMEEAVRV